MAQDARAEAQMLAQRGLADIDAPKLDPQGSTSAIHNPGIEGMKSLSLTAYPEEAMIFTRTRPATPYDRYNVTLGSGETVSYAPTEVHDILSGIEEKQVVLAEGVAIHFTYFTVDTFDTNGVRLSRTYIPDSDVPGLPTMRERTTGFVEQEVEGGSYPAGKDYTSSVVSPDGTEHEVTQRSFVVADSVEGKDGPGSWYKGAFDATVTAHIAEGLTQSAAEAKAKEDLALPAEMQKKGSRVLRAEDSRTPDVVSSRSAAFKPNFAFLQTDMQRQKALQDNFGVSTLEELTRKLTPTTGSDFPFPQFVVEPQPLDTYVYVMCAVDVSPDNGPTFTVAAVNRATSRVDRTTQVYLGIPTPGMSVYHYDESTTQVTGRDEYAGSPEAYMHEEVTVKDGQRVFYRQYAGQAKNKDTTLGPFTPEE